MEMDLYQLIITLGSLGTFGTVLILAYIEIIRPWLNAPQLKIDFEQKEPYCKEIDWIFKNHLNCLNQHRNITRQIHISSYLILRHQSIHLLLNLPFHFH